MKTTKHELQRLLDKSRFIRHYGFRVMNRAEITKYRAFYPESVYLSTVIKNLETAEPLSAYSNSSV